MTKIERETTRANTNSVLYEKLTRGLSGSGEGIDNSTIAEKSSRIPNEEKQLLDQGGG